ncbi:PadR family transcriptional regulator [Murinocardiopsis flavida]|uniref:PadR family transcriptional regulator n=1 Tax=Murinocardiopsis flavida TaxID=645275 RepID=UPI001472ED18|nr:PadR family transcriptional regulator [Murinocardiopsis flavida]
MKFLILGLLIAKPLSLYELHARFDAGLTHIYAASYGSIHRALRQLHAAGDIAQVDEPRAPRNAKRYAATGQGRGAWREWMGRPQPSEDSEASMLARVLLLGVLETTAERKDVLLALHRRALADLAEIRAVDTTLGAPGDATATQRYPRATLDYGVRASAEMVRWLEQLLGELAPDEGTAERGSGHR